MTFNKMMDSLENNAPLVYYEITDILLGIIDNILNHPDDVAYKTLSLSDDVVVNKLSRTNGAMEYLLYMGFQIERDSLVLGNVNILTFESYKSEIIASRERYATKSKATAHTLLQKLKNKQIMCSHIAAMVFVVTSFEDEELQRKGLSVLPEHIISRNDQARESAEEEMLFFENLLAWFKGDFFTWVNNPPCDKCGSTRTLKVGFSHHPNPTTNRIELYECDDCSNEVTFPRYNNPADLLVTRRGRCGEWANCFTFLCRCLKFDARLIVDKEDHAWTEVYSEIQKRWIHCDPCEAALDTPLMYEKGWGKNLSFILAFSWEEVQDVTWRYTTRFNRVLNRRLCLSEVELTNELLRVSKAMQSKLPADRRRYLAYRRMVECGEFLLPPVKSGQYGGRTSGSLAWRMSRQECDAAAANVRIWRPNRIEADQKMFKIRYSPVKDAYERPSTNETLPGWQNGIFEYCSIFRKMELDWKICYLCRMENAAEGCIVWKFNTQSEVDDSLRVDKISVKCESECFENGLVEWEVGDGQRSLFLMPGENEGTEAFRGCQSVVVSAKLMGGSGRLAWQHAQLFRQSTKTPDQYPFEVCITFF